MHNLARKDTKESGFTLIELLIVILIIGILTAIAVPAFLNQRKEAARASMESDLKNAATVMENEIIKNGGKYPPAIPVYTKQSEGNKVFLDAGKSSTASFCLNATNDNYPDMKRSYSSLDGGILPAGKTCSDSTMEGTSQQLSLNDKSVLLVNTGRPDPKYDNNILAGLHAAGFTTIDEIERGTLTKEKALEHDLVVVAGGVWAAEGSDRTAAEAAYQEGARIFSDGNDSNQWSNPLIETSVARQSTPENKMLVQVNPTYNEGLNPTFPYTFNANSFSSEDNWVCAKTAIAGAVVIADSVDPQATDEKCLTMIGATSGAGGRWVHTVLAPTDYSAPNTNSTVNALRWLVQ